MASAQSSQCFLARHFVRSYDHDPGSTSAVITSPDGGTTIRTLDMSLYGRFIASAMTSVLGGNGITKLEIIAAATATMASAEVIKDSGTVAVDAVGDNVVLECSAEEVAQIGAAAGKELRYVAARVTCHHAGDEAVVTYIGAEPRFAYKDLTANYIS